MKLSFLAWARNVLAHTRGDPEFVIFTSIINLRPKSVLMKLSFLAWARIVLAHTRGTQNLLYLPQLSFWDRSRSWWSCLSLPEPGLCWPTPGGPRTCCIYLNYHSEADVGLDEVVFPCLGQDSVGPHQGDPERVIFTSIIILRPKSVLMKLSFLAWSRIVLAHTRGTQNLLLVYLPQLSFWGRSRS